MSIDICVSKKFVKSKIFLQLTFFCQCLFLYEPLRYFSAFFGFATNFQNILLAKTFAFTLFFVYLKLLIIITMNINQRSNMLNIHIDSDSDDEPRQKPMKGNVVNLKDKFKTSAISKGMFCNQDEQIDYNTIPCFPVTKILIDESQTKHSHPTTNRVVQMQKQAEEVTAAIKEQQHNDSQNEHKTSEQSQQYISNIPSLRFTQQMMKMQFSSDQDSEEIQISKQPQSKTQHKTIEMQEIDTKMLLQGVTNICQFSRNFCTKPIQPHQYLKLSIYRNSSGLNSLWPQFQVFMGKFCQQFLFAKKMVGSTTSNFYITSEQGVQKVEDINFIAKMRSNFAGSLYNIFDKGVSPQKASKFTKKRCIQATIRFKSQILNLEPRQFQLFMLKPGNIYDELCGAIPNRQIGLDALYGQQANKQKIYYFKNRKPVYSQQLKGFILNFSGRVKVPSIKNFILQDCKTKRQVIMLGKTDENIFRIDVSEPIPPYIALCVCLANIDSKFYCD